MTSSGKKKDPAYERRNLQRKFGTTLARSCGYPRCDVRITVELQGDEPDFKGATYCSPAHQQIAANYRAKLRSSIKRLEDLLDDPTPAPRAPKGKPQEGLTNATLTSWLRRLRWELDGMPDP